MYKKDADRLILRDVRARLGALRMNLPWADWLMAAMNSISEHPEWYRHHLPNTIVSVRLLLTAGGVDMTETEKPFEFIGI